MKHASLFAVLSLVVSLSLPSARAADLATAQVTVAQGVLQGRREASGIASFKGIPFAQPPVGDLRWRAPQPALPWTGVRSALEFAPRAMQQPLFSDMVFRGGAPSEDSLYLNVWTPARAAAERLPVLVYFYGGGFAAGDGSEPRYDGERMATHGIVTVTVNYRLGVFGFFAHPELTKESPHGASGNYGLLDQAAALQWVRDNIAAFGGDPGRVTIAGESAGSMSVSAQMASPLSRGLIAGAIGQSGASVARRMPTLAEAERTGVTSAARWGLGDAPTLAALRAMPAAELLEKAGRGFAPIVDGYFFPRHPDEIYAAGEQAKVPLLAGSTNAEAGGTLGGASERPLAPAAMLQAQLEAAFPGHGAEALQHYPAGSEAEARVSARELASDRFISFGTWKWLDLATATGGQPTYYFLFAFGRPPAVQGGGWSTLDGRRPPAVHSADIEYSLDTLAGTKAFAWTEDDYAVARVFSGYVANFVKTGNPNGPGLPEWPTYARGHRQIIDLRTTAEKVAPWKARYEFYGRAIARP